MSILVKEADRSKKSKQRSCHEKINVLMKVEFLAKFLKDIDDILQPLVKKAVKGTIERIETSSSLMEIPNCKKLKAYKNAYRILIGNFRMGIYMEGGIVEIARVVDRKDFYKIFP